MKQFISLLLGTLLASTYAWSIESTVITVSAASSLTNVFKDITPVFERQHPAIKVQLNFASSGQLLQQIAKGAPVDVLASADQETMDWAQDNNLIKKKTRKNFASNTLVLVVPKLSNGQPKQIPSGLSDLLRNNYQRIVVGLPASVPVGRYTKAVLEKYHLWSVLEPKIISAQNVRQALDYIARSEVDAGFVYATDALMSADVQVAFTIPTENKILYPIAITQASSHEKEAQQFITFVNGPAGQALLAKYGFGKP